MKIKIPPSVQCITLYDPYHIDFGMLYKIHSIANLYNILERPRSLPSMWTPSTHLKMNWLPMDCTSSGSYGIYTVPAENDMTVIRHKRTYQFELYTEFMHEHTHTYKHTQFCLHIP